MQTLMPVYVPFVLRKSTFAALKTKWEGSKTSYPTEGISQRVQVQDATFRFNVTKHEAAGGIEVALSPHSIPRTFPRNMQSTKGRVWDVAFFGRRPNTGARLHRLATHPGVPIAGRLVECGLGEAPSMVSFPIEELHQCFASASDTAHMLRDLGLASSAAVVEKLGAKEEWCSLFIFMGKVENFSSLDDFERHSARSPMHRQHSENKPQDVDSVYFLHMPCVREPEPPYSLADLRQVQSYLPPEAPPIVKEAVFFASDDPDDRQEDLARLLKV